MNNFYNDSRRFFLNSLDLKTIVKDLEENYDGVHHKSTHEHLRVTIFPTNCGNEGVCHICDTWTLHEVSYSMLSIHPSEPSNHTNKCEENSFRNLLLLGCLCL